MANSDTDTTDTLDDPVAPEESAEEQKPKLALDVKVDKTSACERHVTVTIAQEDIERYFNNEFDELMPKAEVPGFRPGHAPRKLVERRFRQQVSDKVKSELLMDSMTQIGDEQEFSAISEPDFDFDAVEVPEEGPMTFEFDIEVRPEFDLPEWKGLQIEKPTREFSEDDVERHMSNLLARYGQLVPHDGPAEADDYATVDIVFRHNGKQVSELREQNIRVKPRVSFADATLQGFDKLVVGAEAGEKRTTKVALSADADNEELRGEDIDVEIDILDVKKLELPTLDAKLLERIGDFAGEDQLREAVKSELQRQLAYYQHRRVREQITSMLTESADWELPPDLLKRQASRELERARMELQAAGFSDQDIRARSNELRQNILSSTATALKEHFILERIAEEAEIEDEPEDYDREIALIAFQQNDSPRRIRARLEKRGQMDALRNQIIERKVIDLITSHAQFTEVKFEPEASATEAVDHAIGGAHGGFDIPEAKHGGDAAPLREKADHT